MRTLQHLTIAAFLTLLITSCGNSSKTDGKTEADVTPLTTEIKGDIGNYLEIVDGTYQVVALDETFNDWELTFKLRNKQTGDINEDNYDIDFKLVLTDEQGKPITGLGEFWMTDGRWATEGEMQKLRALITEEPGSEEWFTLPMEADNDTEWENYLPDDVKHFTIRTEVEEVERVNTSSTTKQSQTSDTYSSQTTTANSNTGTVSDEDWDAVLNEYEDYVNEYIKFIKKANTGDLTALSEYPTMLEKAETFTRKLENVQGQLTVSQIARFNALQLKLTKAAQELQSEL